MLKVSEDVSSLPRDARASGRPWCCVPLSNIGFAITVIGEVGSDDIGGDALFGFCDTKRTIVLLQKIKIRSANQES